MARAYVAFDAKIRAAKQRYDQEYAEAEKEFQKNQGEEKIDDEIA
jgi:hypothetical protein